MIILVGAEKGGCGKSTLAVNLAVIAASAGKDVLLVDTDKQGSAGSWAAIRAEIKGIPHLTCITKFGKGLQEDIRRLSVKHDIVIMDAGGKDSIELRQGMLIANRMLIPSRASQFDAWSLETMNDLVYSARGFNEHLDAMVAVNCASTNPRISETDELRSLVEDLEHLRLADARVCDRIVFRKSIREGLGVTEMTPEDGKAVFEIRRLYKEIVK